LPSTSAIKDKKRLLDHLSFKELEKENSRLKKLVANISLDNAILKEAARGNS
jgi:hypothetical protein